MSRAMVCIALPERSLRRLSRDCHISVSLHVPCTRSTISMGIFSRLMSSPVRPFIKSSRRRPEGCARPRLEELESRLLLHANVVMDAEHLAVFGATDAAGVVTGGLVPD